MVWRDGIHILAVLAFINCSSASILSAGGSGTSTGNSGGDRGSSGGGYYSDSVFRSLDNHLLRIGSRLDQLMVRIDHLDARVGRVQSTGHLRFDSIETSMQTTRQRLDLWSNQLNLIEEQFARKMKNLESRFDTLVSSLDSKLDTKFNLVQRDNRRHNEFISSAFNNVVIGQEKMSDRVGAAISQLNATVKQTQSLMTNTSLLTKSHSLTCTSRIDDFLQNLTYQMPSRPHTVQPATDQQVLFPRPPYPNYPIQSGLNSSAQLVSSKVSNMFDELVKRSLDLEAIVKDSYTMSNMTRKEVTDGFMALIPIISQVGEEREQRGNEGDVLSMVLEAVSSMEQLSTSLGRRMAEMRNSINERFEVVSMTLNGFLESCLRIQDKTPQLEEKIGEVLWRILDSVDNSTRNATETWQKVKSALGKETRNCTEAIATSLSTLTTAEEEDTEDSGLKSEHEYDTGHTDKYDGLGQDIEDGLMYGLTEEQKKLMWDSLSRMADVRNERVPE